MKYLPNTDRDRKLMQESIDISSVEEIFAEIPEEVRYKQKLDLPDPLSELELVKHLKELAGNNRSQENLISFMGGGSYDHYIPSTVDHVLSRGEFYTAYTPYQAEVSQGTLQTIFEFQTMISELTGMQITNASMYDGASALAEAAIMAVTITKERSKIVVPTTVNPSYSEVLSTYIRGRDDIHVVQIPYEEGILRLKELEKEIDETTAAVLVQQPNFFGNLEPVLEASEIAQRNGAKFVVCADPISLGIIKAPGHYGADIAVGEGQSMGNPQYWGGPGLGFFAARKEYLRRMPGRIVGQTTDAKNNRGFVLTLQTREQHIRRQKATSNICSNQALNALASAVYMTLLGKEGIKEAAGSCLQKAHYAHEKITGLKGFESGFSKPFFKEFVVKCPVPAKEITARLLEEGYLAGIELDRFYPEMDKYLLISVTEKRTKEEIDSFAARLGELI